MGKPITINGIRVNPETQARELAAADLHAVDASASNYILIQTKDPLTKDQKEELSAKGVVILEYVPEDTYVCEYKPADLEEIRSLPYVEWANVYMKGFKISPELKLDLPADAGPRNILEMTRTEEPLSRKPKTVDVVFHQGVDPKSVLSKVAAAAGLDPSDLKFGNQKIRLTVQAQRLANLAAIDEVRDIEPVVPMKLHNNIARQILHLDNAAVALSHLEGEGQIVAVADTGFDKGSTSDVHPAFTGRVTKLYALGRQGKANDPDGHGTHVAGSVLGDGNSPVLGSAVRGTAPKAKLVLQSVLDQLDGLGGLPEDLGDLFEPPYKNDGARIHTNSWGSTGNFGMYDSYAKELDDFVWKHRDCVVCFAAGNAGKDKNKNGIVDLGSVTPPATAKNCIAVGASENNRPDFSIPDGRNKYGELWPNDFPTPPLFNDKVADNPEGMVAFSSRGPTRDGRIRPDVVAPGTAILSTLSRAVQGPEPGWGSSKDPLYFYDSGTSMACPLVAGCAALVCQFLIKERGIANPSAALVKALLINGARSTKGQYTPSEVGSIPNNDEGFGIVDMTATIGPFGPGHVEVLKNETHALAVGEEDRITVQVPAGAKALKVTLVWTDPPGEVLQNDLDLVVRTAGGEERHGNAAAGSTSFDRVNNVEQVLWENVPPGDVEVIVKAYRTVRDPQPYALVVRTA